ncbi:Flagellar basal-body rod protein FlgG [Litoreibacter arenae DSM 19593]|uniref:Flagellar basal-body rod protein FlgF n=2 Tax=Litoreibacter TaxID=947567 RepID=S9Q7G7_9RHOB|nr:Flagellar basal-body rod protein FlgG [Litoreibacter arenae DSM 19593]
MKEMRLVANNIANMATTGFRSEKAIFSEHVVQLGLDGESLSMARAGAHVTDFAQGALTKTGGTFDLGIEGNGFFQIETPAGVRLTRAGAFSILPTGELVSPEGYPLLDAGGASLTVPVDVTDISISGDGTVSADGNPIGQIALVVPSDENDLEREDGVMFKTASDVLPAEGASMSQGFLEASNVEAVTQVARMIEVQRSYEMGQSFLEKEDERLRSILTLVGGR